MSVAEVIRCVDGPLVSVHKKVEEGPECPSKNRFGPYTTREEASHAMETARERNLEWETDPRWHDAGGKKDGDAE
ncbi:hypothetical protein ACWDNT_15885 [Streptomyces sp. NPDC000963]